MQINTIFRQPESGEVSTSITAHLGSRLWFVNCAIRLDDDDDDDDDIFPFYSSVRSF